MAPYSAVYQLPLVAVSVLIAILAAFVALSISSRIVAARSRRGRLTWAAAGAFSMGGGIWAMHFIGMLAFSLPCGISYDPLGTALSMIPGVLASGVALHVISRVGKPSLRRLIIGAVLMGSGIGAMHYSGMAAMLTEARLTYEPGLVLVSVIVAVVLAFISLAVRFELRRRWSSDAMATIVAASIMGLAVSGMHYTAMRAAVFFPLTDVMHIGMALPETMMAVLVTVITILIALIALVASVAGRQSELAYGLTAEVARRKALEQEAEGGRARLQAIFDAVADAIVTVDRSGGILQWSHGAQHIFGYAPEEVIGSNLMMLMPEPYRSRHAGYVGAFLRTRDPKVIGIGRELTAVRKDGTEFPIELTVSEVLNGAEVFFTGILRDITERKRAEAELVRAREEAVAANHAKSQFLATMSHEIRTPMNGVLGMASLLSSTPLNDRQQRLVDNVSRSGQALLEIINDILDFAKIEAGKFELSAVPFDPREAMSEMTDLFSDRCAAKGLEFIYFVAEDVPSQLVGDPVRLRQILINLVGNAIKFTERGEILVELSLARKDADGVLLSFIVEDTGIGIPPDQCARVFESFYQVDGSLTRTRGGSGLGLSITRQLVELMGGKITAESELGRGSRFTFTACLQLSRLETEAPRAPRHLPRPLRTLLVDANAVSAQVISQYLANWRLDTTIVPDVSEAETAWHDAASAGQPFDVAILDIKGLGARAIEFAKSARAEVKPRRAELILLVGLDSFVSDSSLNALDAAAILPKPVRPSDLFNALVSIASDGSQRKLVSHLLRRKAQTERPNFAARILIAEDNPVNQEVASGMLETMGCRFVTAPNGRVAFRLFAEEQFDLVLMDCEMPIMDGIESTRRIREIEAMAQGLSEDGKSRQRTPIVALTAHAINEVRERCINAGMDDFLVKPFDDRQLAATLRRWLVPQGMMDAPADADVGPSPVAADSHPDPVIDATVIAVIRKGGAARLGRAVSRFLEVAPNLATTIRDSCEKGDAEALWQAAHSLKSSAGALGAKLLSQRCGEIESTTRNAGVDAAKPLVAAFDEDLTAAVRGLQALIGETYVPA